MRQWSCSQYELCKVINCMPAYLLHISWPTLIRCSVAMQERPVSDSKSWRCPQCKGRKSIHDGSFFSKSRLSLQKWLLLYFWVPEYPVTDAMEEAEVNKGTEIDIYQWFREVCFTIVLGGPGKIVRVNESLFRHKPKVRIYYCI